MPKRIQIVTTWGLIAAAGALAYSDSFSGPFVFDAAPSILGNPSLRHLWPLWRALSPPGDVTTSGRPLVNLSLAVNYALGGGHVAGYHVANLLIHLLAGLVLFGLVRRALGTGLGLAAALLWTLQPLQTESVTYVIQRAESLMGLCFLFTLYGFVRAAEPGALYPRVWYAASWAACALGMASKEVMVAAPLVVLLYDRTFLAASFRAAWRLRRSYYGALAGTWLILAWCVATAGSRNGTAGLGAGLSPWSYGLIQLEAIPRYLALSAWPSPLVFYYGDSLKPHLAWMLLGGAVVALLCWAAVRALTRRSPLGFLAACTLLVLAPTSSLLPIPTELMAEHRMYLALAPVLIGLVLAIRVATGRYWAPVLVSVAAAFAALTWARNRAYRSDLALWTDTLAKSPDNAAAHNALGVALEAQGHRADARAQYGAALSEEPGYSVAWLNLGNVERDDGRMSAAQADFERAVQSNPDSLPAWLHLGFILNAQGRTEGAVDAYRHAVRLNPSDVASQFNLANALAGAGQNEDAVGHYEQALAGDSTFAEAEYDLGNVLLRLGRLPAAEAHYRAALRLRPDFPEALLNLGNLCLQSGRPAEAVPLYEAALRRRPNLPDAQYDLQLALKAEGQPRR